MTVSSKVRIYDLAKELKLDTKRLIEEVRREGVDVSVPSNSVSKELAEKIRNKYFPKKETAVKRAVKVVKRAALPTPEAPAVEVEVEEHEPEAEFEAASTPSPEPIEAPAVAPAQPAAAKQPIPARLVKKLICGRLVRECGVRPLEAVELQPELLGHHRSEIDEDAGVRLGVQTQAAGSACALKRAWT